MRRDRIHVGATLDQHCPPVCYWLVVFLECCVHITCLLSDTVLSPRTLGLFSDIPKLVMIHVKHFEELLH